MHAHYSTLYSICVFCAKYQTGILITTLEQLQFILFVASDVNITINLENVKHCYFYMNEARIQRVL